MNVRFRASFKKDLKQIKDWKLLEQINNIINEAKNAASSTGINSLTKLKGYDDLYRIRVGNFRIGIKFSDEEFIFVGFFSQINIY